MNRLYSLVLLLFAAACAQASPPNVVLILADDQGWTGTSVQMDRRRKDSKSDLYQTPNLERLADAGMTFSNAYAPAPNCSPTRMSIQTGKTAARLGATDIIDVVPDEQGVAPLFHDTMYVNKPMILPLPVASIADDEVTIAEFIKAHRPQYATGHFGKWHMGGGSPANHGYDAHNGLTTNTEGRTPPPDAKRTRQVTDDAIAFIRQQARSATPFFVQVSYYAVHLPILASPASRAPFQNQQSVYHGNTGYAAMTAELDAGVGQILAALDELGLGPDTYVIYTSDNGGEADMPVTSNVPLAFGKTHVHEGGIRVPLMLRGPGIKPGSASDTPVVGYDFFPTIADWLGIDAELPAQLDGGSLAPLLANPDLAAVERPTPFMVWYYGAYRNFKHVVPQAAIRDGDDKLIWNLESDEVTLFDLALDISETTNLTRFRPARAEALHNSLKDYLKTVGVRLPVHNPNYDPTKDKGLIRPAF
ncbi:MAG: sulfatase [Pseudomonadota bacterium]